MIKTTNKPNIPAHWTSSQSKYPTKITSNGAVHIAFKNIDIASNRYTSFDKRFITFPIDVFSSVACDNFKAYKKS